MPENRSCRKHSKAYSTEIESFCINRTDFSLWQKLHYHLKTDFIINLKGLWKKLSRVRKFRTLTKVWQLLILCKFLGFVRFWCVICKVIFSSYLIGILKIQLWNHVFERTVLSFYQNKHKGNKISCNVQFVKKYLKKGFHKL